MNDGGILKSLTALNNSVLCVNVCLVTLLFAFLSTVPLVSMSTDRDPPSIKLTHNETTLPFKQLEVPPQ